MVNGLRWTLAVAAILLLAACGGGRQNVVIEIDPTSATVEPGGVVEFEATISGTTNDAVRWEATGGAIDGTDTTIRYTAPLQTGTYTVTVTSAADASKDASAEVRVRTLSSQDGARIEITSDLSAVLEGEDDTAMFTAAVYRPDGTVDEGANVTWSSSDPSVVRIGADGVATAQGPFGSAVITAGYGSLAPATANAVVAELAPDAVFVENGDATFVSDTEVVLVANDSTRTIASGDVVVSSSSAGILARVASVEERDDRVILQIEPATMEEAFDEFSVTVVSAPATFAGTIGEDGVVVTNSLGQAVTTQNLANFLDSCEADAPGLSISLSGPSIDWTSTFTATGELDLGGPFAPTETMSIIFDGDVNVSAKSGSFEIAGGIGAGFKCEVEVGTIPVPAIAFGPITLGGEIVPKLGVRGSANFSSDVTVEGPRANMTFETTTGFAYQRGNGLSFPSTFERDGDIWPQPFEASLDPGLEFSVAPYFGMDGGLATTVLNKSLVSFRLFEADVGASFTVRADAPIVPDQFQYRGPQWQAAVTSRGALKAELSMGPLEQLLKKANVELTVSAGELELWDAELVLTRSPDPQVSIASARTEAGRDIILSATVPDRYAGERVEFWSVATGGSTLVKRSEATVDARGQIQASWTPAETDDGSHAIYGYLFDAVFGAANFPYASSQPVYLEVVPPVGPPARSSLNGYTVSDPNEGVVEFSISALDANGRVLPDGVVSDVAVRNLNRGTAAGRVCSNIASLGNLTVDVVLDASGSLDNNDPSFARRDAALDFVRRLAPGDRAGVASFTSSFTRHQGFTTDVPLLEQAVRDATYDSGSTDIWGAVASSVSDLQVESGSNKLLVLFTDGDDSGSPDAAIAAAQSAGVRIYTVGLGSSSSLDFTELEAAAQQTGGLFAAVADATELTRLFDNVFNASSGAGCIEVDFDPGSTSGTGDVNVTGDLDFSVDGVPLSEPFSVDLPSEAASTVDVTISPETATLDAGASTTFTATVTGATDTSLTWNASGGTISGSGSTVTYTAPETPEVYSVTAASVEDPTSTATAYATVEAAPEVSVSVSPTSVVLEAGDSQSFSATVSNATSSSVSWSATCGSFSDTGNPATYVAPGSAGSCTVTATSVEDSSKSASASVAVEETVSLSITPTQATLMVGESLTFTATTTGVDASSLEWSTSCGTLVATDDMAELTAPMSPGPCSVTVAIESGESSSATSDLTITVLKWAREVGSGPFTRDGQSPAIDANGYVVLTSNSRVSRVAPDGSLIWRSADIGARTQPAITSAGMIYVGTETGIAAMNPWGNLEWTFDPGARVEAMPVFGANQHVFFADMKGTVYALDSFGDQRWSFQTEQPYATGISASPIVTSDGVIIVPTNGGQVYAIRDGPECGPCARGGFSSVSASPALGSGDTLYFAESFLWAFENGISDFLWSFPLNQWTRSTPLVRSDGSIVISDQTRLVSISPTGLLEWEVPLGANAYYFTGVIDADDSAYVYTQDDLLRKISASGDVMWSFDLGNGQENRRSFGLTIAQDGTLYVHRDSELIALAAGAALGPDGWPKHHADQFNGGSAIR